MNRLLPQSSDVLRSMAGASRAGQRGGTVIGVVVGLLAGLVLAVVVAVFVMKSPGPFVEKVKRPGEVSTDGDALPDPNKSLSKGKAEANAPDVPGTPGSEAGADAAVEAKGSAPAVGPGTAGGAAPADASASASSPTSGSPAPVSVATPMPPVPVLPAGAGASAAGGATPAGSATGASAPSSPAAPAASAIESPERASTYLLQIAAYRSQEDAESTKGRLALVGLEAGIVRAEVNGITFWRVRVGPFRDLDETNRARTRLAENGFDSSVIRVR